MTQGKTVIIMLIVLLIGFGAGFVLRPSSPRPQLRRWRSQVPQDNRAKRGASSISGAMSRKPEKSWKAVARVRCAAPNAPMPKKRSSRSKRKSAAVGF